MGRSRSNSENPWELVLASDPSLGSVLCDERENRGMSLGVAGGERAWESVRLCVCGIAFFIKSSVGGLIRWLGMPRKWYYAVSEGAGLGVSSLN